MPRRMTQGAAAPVIVAFWSAVDLLRPLLLVYVVHQFWRRLDEVVHPGRGCLVLALLALWTVLTLVQRRRTPAWLGAELLLGVAGILASGLVDSREVIAAGAPTIPGMWPAATVLSWAVLAGPLGGTCAAVAVAVADLVVVGSPSPVTLHNIVILLLLGSLVGYCADLVRESHRVSQEAEAARVRTAERERLSRSVHDGVLQALSYVHRRGLELGGEAGELGRLAAEQERSLRELIRLPAPENPDQGAEAEDEADLGALLTGRAGERVSVVDTGERVVLPAGRAQEIDAAVGAALDNVRQHAGVDARAWVLLERIDGDVMVTVRDNGGGIAPGRLEEACDEGRLGVRSSIQGRLADLGGTAEITSSSSGTRVAMRAPLRAGRGRP